MQQLKEFPSVDQGDRNIFYGEAEDLAELLNSPDGDPVTEEPPANATRNNPCENTVSLFTTAADGQLNSVTSDTLIITQDVTVVLNDQSLRKG